MAAQPTHYADIQQKTFTRWCNDYLSERGMKVNDLKTDLRDGLFLINLLEVISGKSLGRYNKHPKIPFQKLENLGIALNFIKEEGIKLVNISPEDINGCNLRLILGLIWTLILRYEIKTGSGDEKNATNELLEWIRKQIPEYDIKGFTKDWNDGKAICALANSIKPGLIPDHKTLSGDALANCTKGIDAAAEYLGVDRLIFPDEMANPKVDKLAMMTYLAQFRNIKPSDIKEQASEASLFMAHGPGLVEGIAGEDAPFTVEGPAKIKGKLEIKVVGPKDEAKVDVKDNKDGTWSVSYRPSVPGTYKVHVTVGGEHIPGSIFTVEILAQESLGGEGKIRVFYSTTASAQKSRADRRSLETLLTNKKVHLRPDFEPWHAVDVMERDDREAVFKRAGSRNLPIVFIDDQYIGDYDKLMELEEGGKLDALLNMKGQALVSEDEHQRRLAGMSMDGAAPVKQAIDVPARSGGGGGAAAEPAAPAKATAFCKECGSPLGATAKFCLQCGTKA